MATLSALQTEVYEELGLNATDDATKVTRELNKGVRDVLRRTRCYQDQVTATPGAVSEYTLASTVLDIVDLAVQGQATSPERLAPHMLRRFQRQTASSTGAVQFYALAGANLLLFYPALGASTVLDMLVVPVPTALSAAGDDPSAAANGGIPVDYHDLISRFAMAKLASFSDDVTSAQGQRYWQEYLGLVREARRQLLRMGGSRLPRARVGARSRLVPHNPSTDLGY